MLGDSVVVANATCCSSIYGGNLLTTPWTRNAEGLGPAWSTSLFEDNAEFGLGMRLTLDKQKEFACELLSHCAGIVGEDLVQALLTADQSGEAGIKAQRGRVALLKQRLKSAERPDEAVDSLLSVADALVKKSVWIIGGDGWGYDIGFGRPHQVLASRRDVDVPVLDTQMHPHTDPQ